MSQIQISQTAWERAEWCRGDLDPGHNRFGAFEFSEFEFVSNFVLRASDFDRW
jgi:hypothetical protein